MKENIENLVKEALVSLGVTPGEIVVEHPVDLSHGDYSTSVALAYAKEVRKSPKALAEELVEILNKNKGEYIEKIDIAGPGFINFHLAPQFFYKSVEEIVKRGEGFGKNESLKGKKLFIEHTQPNPFKEFHIGHLMNNAIGESIVRLAKANGAEVKTATYHGDVGLHVAKAIWGILQVPDSFVGAYARGHKAFEDDETTKGEIIEINKKIYDQSDNQINLLYEAGRNTIQKTR